MPEKLIIDSTEDTPKVIFDAENKILPTFCLSFEALKHLGVNTPANLPNYNDLHTHEFVERILGNGNLNSDQAE